jgi:hypothetical protein
VVAGAQSFGFPKLSDANPARSIAQACSYAATQILHGAAQQ